MAALGKDIPLAEAAGIRCCPGSRPAASRKCAPRASPPCASTLRPPLSPGLLIVGQLALWPVNLLRVRGELQQHLGPLQDVPSAPHLEGLKLAMLPW